MRQHLDMILEGSSTNFALGVLSFPFWAETELGSSSGRQPRIVCF